MSMRYRDGVYEDDGSVDEDRATDGTWEGDRGSRIERGGDGAVENARLRGGGSEEREDSGSGENQIDPCPMCGGRHRGSFCQMPPPGSDYVG